MELTPLRYFLAVAEDLHFGHAASRLFIAQPALSRHIMRLEDELGVRLFNRTSRRVTLTGAGRTFLKEARAVLDRADSAVDRMKILAEGGVGQLSVGFNEPALNTFLSTAVKAFRSEYPDVRLELCELETGEQISALRANRIHLGLLRPYGHDLTGLRSRLLFSEEYVLAVPEDHRLTAKESVALADLARTSLILFPRRAQPRLHAAIVDCCIRAGFEPRIIQEAVSKQTTLTLVAAGIGVAIVPHSSSLVPHPGVAFRPLTGDLPPVEIMALWRADVNMVLIENFLQNIR